LGVRRIGVFSAPPLGCLPALKTMNGNSGKGCVDDPNEAAKLFNAKLSAELDDLNNNLPHSKVVYIDVYDPLLDIIQNPKKHGNISSSFLIFLNLNFLYINLGFLANNLYVVI
jgi:phospholipase/lecithinase/hemolysin